MIAKLRTGSCHRLAFAATAITLALMSGVANAETHASAVAKTAATSNAVLNANAKVTSAKATHSTAGKPVRVRQSARMAAQPEQCSFFWCGRRQVSWLILGIGF